ncbi:NUDIX hydrolase [Streptomyces sp. AS02]|uniref:NUDIX hydrolase n=1 Tax=Streptomyces sp. AS02 TaxID=2938946 RepID=UPI002020798E|nr:NUDIX domain-containing protein [Streptomyces sp. AS02]MCL8013434.1 NUDIX domain-containing protein [Streptomyces sp. AS02]
MDNEEFVASPTWFPHHSAPPRAFGRDQEGIAHSAWGRVPAAPRGKAEPGETPGQCARRELLEEVGNTANSWRDLGTYAMSLDSTAGMHLFEATQLICGPQQLMPWEAGFRLMWWSMGRALAAVNEGRFLLPGGPLALLLADSADACSA